MLLGSREHYEMLESFEKSVKDFIFSSGMSFDKEEKDLWKSGNIYKHGETNKLFRVFSLGYSTARSVYLS